MTARERAVAIGLALLAVCAIAAYFRFVGLNWDEAQHLHPDERFLSMVESAIQPASSAREYLDTNRSPLNPYNRGHKFFPYGHFPLIAVQYVASWFGRPDVDVDSRWFGRELSRAFDSGYLIGRSLSASCDILSLLGIFLIGRTLYGAAVGVVAAALYAGAVFPIQQAHFFTVDAWTTLFVVIAFGFAVRISRATRWSDDLLFGLSFGLALASKINVLPIAFILIVAVAQRLVRVYRSRLNATSATEGADFRAAAVRSALSLNVAALAAVLAFRLGQPYAFTPPRVDSSVQGYGSGWSYGLALLEDIVAPSFNPAWLDQMREISAIVSSSNDSPPGYQWAQRTPLVFPWLNMVRFGLGWPLGLAAWAGWAAALWQMVRRRRGNGRHLLPVLWIGLFFTWQGVSWVKSMRYFLPLYPFLVLLAAWGLVRGGGMLSRRLRSRLDSDGEIMVAALPAILVLLTTYGWAFAFTRIYTRPVTRVAASQWILDHVPSDIFIEVESARGPCRQTVGVVSDWTFPVTWDLPVQPPPVALLESAKPRAVKFVATCSGVTRELTFHSLQAGASSLMATSLEVAIATSDQRDSAIAAATMQVQPADLDHRNPYRLDLNAPLQIGREYRLILTAEGGDLSLSGAALGVAGHWEDWIPLKIAGHDPWFADYQPYAFEIFDDDHAEKRRRLQYVLDQVDYVIVSSNRFYDSLSRIPARWPMTIDYYRALFSGELGFDLAAEFHSFPQLGSWEIDDRSAEEAFSVYDHPRVMIFQKRPRYEPTVTAGILGRTDLSKVVRQRPDQATGTPVWLELPTM